MTPSVCAIVCAAGRGERAGFGKNKLLVPFGGSTALEKSVAAFDLPAVSKILVTASAEDFGEISKLCARFPRTRAVRGGETRFLSVLSALREAKSEIALVHDGARPFVRHETVEGCISSVLRFGSGVCAVPSVDTVALSDGNGYIASVPPRQRAFALQTPQGFRTAELLSAYEAAAAQKQSAAYTDDSSVYAAFVAPPRLCAGSRDNIKLTFSEDFSPPAPPARVGLGIDTHAFGKAQNFILLAGVKIPSESGLVAHSDGDVLAHAVMDAMLSAAGLKDIGHYFPDTDEKWAGADSMQMLSEVRKKVEAEGFAAENLSVAVQAEKPRLKNYIDAMKRALSAALGVGENAVGISAGTNEGLGDIGRGKGICVRACVLLRRL